MELGCFEYLIYCTMNYRKFNNTYVCKREGTLLISVSHLSFERFNQSEGYVKYLAGLVDGNPSMSTAPRDVSDRFPQWTNNE